MYLETFIKIVYLCTMFFGRIITRSKRIEANELIDVTSDIASIDPSIPTLIVGKQLAVEMFGADKVKVLNKNIDKNISWTFLKTERRSDFEKDISNFKNDVMRRITKSVKYYYVDVITSSAYKMMRFVRMLADGRPKTVFIRNNNMYIYVDKWVFGVSLDDIEYIGINRNKVFSFIKRLRNVRFVYDNKNWSIELKRETFDNAIIVPYISFVLNNDFLRM